MSTASTATPASAEVAATTGVTAAAEMPPASEVRPTAEATAAAEVPADTAQAT
jgi:hypothetical protein